MLTRIKDISISIFFLTLTTISINLWWNARLFISTIQPKISGTLFQSQLAAQTIQSTFKAQAQELNSQEQLMARKNAQIAGAEFLQHLAYVTTPLLDKQLKTLTATTKKLETVAEQSRQLIANVDRELTEQILPTSTHAIASIDLLARKISTDSNVVLSSLNSLIQEGKLSAEIVNKRLNDPKFDDILTHAIELEIKAAGAIDASKEVILTTNKVAENIDEATKPLGTMVRRAEKWQKVFNAARVLSILIRVFSPWLIWSSLTIKT